MLVLIQAMAHEEKWKKNFERMVQEVLNAKADRDLHLTDKMKMEEENQKMKLVKNRKIVFSNCCHIIVLSELVDQHKQTENIILG